MTDSSPQLASGDPSGELDTMAATTTVPPTTTTNPKLSGEDDPAMASNQNSGSGGEAPTGATLISDVIPAYDAAHLTMTQAAKLTPSPTIPGSMEAAVKMWLQVGNIQKLQQAVLDGYGWLLQDHSSRLPHVNKFLKKVPEFQQKIDLIHEQVIRGDLRAVRKLLDKRGWANARDHYGHSPLHKAVMANQDDVVRYILAKFPELVEVRDNEGRTPLHYAAALQGTTNGVNQLYQALVEAGADENAVDVQGHSPAYYRDHPQDIRHRTVQSRRPPPVTTHLIKGDPDSATSPSKYNESNHPSSYEQHEGLSPHSTAPPRTEDEELEAELEAAIQESKERAESQMHLLQQYDHDDTPFRTLSTSEDEEDAQQQKVNAQEEKKRSPRRTRRPPKEDGNENAQASTKRRVRRPSGERRVRSYAKSRPVDRDTQNADRDDPNPTRLEDIEHINQHDEPSNKDKPNQKESPKRRVRRPSGEKRVRPHVKNKAAELESLSSIQNVDQIDTDNLIQPEDIEGLDLLDLQDESNAKEQPGLKEPPKRKVRRPSGEKRVRPLAKPRPSELATQNKDQTQRQGLEQLSQPPKEEGTENAQASPKRRVRRPSGEKRVRPYAKDRPIARDTESADQKYPDQAQLEDIEHINQHDEPSSKGKLDQKESPKRRVRRPSVPSYAKNSPPAQDSHLNNISSSAQLENPTELSQRAAPKAEPVDEEEGGRIPASPQKEPEKHESGVKRRKKKTRPKPLTLKDDADLFKANNIASSSSPERSPTKGRRPNQKTFLASPPTAKNAKHQLPTNGDSLDPRKSPTKSESGADDSLGGLIDMETLIAVQESRAAGLQGMQVSVKDIQAFLHRSRMHLKVNDIRRHLDIAKAIGAMDTKKLKEKSQQLDHIRQEGDEELQKQLEEELKAAMNEAPPSPGVVVHQPKARAKKKVKKSNGSSTASSSKLQPVAAVPVREETQPRLELPKSKALAPLREEGQNKSKAAPPGPPALGKLPSYLKNRARLDQVNETQRRQETQKAQKAQKAARRARIESRKDKEAKEGATEEEESPHRMTSFTMKRMMAPLVPKDTPAMAAVRKKKELQEPESEATEEFYKAFKIVFVDMPIPNEDQPLPPPNRAYLRTLIHNSDLEHLEKVVLDGHGYRLLQESSSIGKVTKFLSTLPDFMDTISILHNAVTAGVVAVVTELLTSERLALSRDIYGATPLHKAVLFYQPKIVKLISEKYRIATRAKDQEGRTPLHYAAALHDSGIFYRYLLKCGADELIQDKYGKTAKYYVYSPGDIDLNVLVGRCKEMPRKREHQESKKFSMLPSQQIQQDVFVHSNPPKVISTSQLRTWIRHSDLENLEQVVLDGHGHKLIFETASDGKIRAFIKAVPVYMKKIESLHEFVVKGNLSELQANLTRRKLAVSKDDNGHGLLHKAVYFGQKEITTWLLEKFPETAEVKDWDGRVPLHYTACNPKSLALAPLFVNVPAPPLANSSQATTPVPGANGQQQPQQQQQQKQGQQQQQQGEQQPQQPTDDGPEDALGHTPKYYRDHPNELSIPPWRPRPIPVPPTSPKKSIPPLKAGTGMERAAMSVKAKREEREQREALERKYSSPEKRPLRAAAIDGKSSSSPHPPAKGKVTKQS